MATVTRRPRPGHRASTRSRISRAALLEGDREHLVGAHLAPVQQVVEVVPQIPPAVETEVDVEVTEEKPSVAIQQQPEIDKEPLTVILEDVPSDLKKEKCTPMVKEKRTACPQKRHPGVKVSRELLEMAGFPEHQHIHNLSIK